LLAAFCGKAVILGAAIVLGDSVFGCDPGSLDEAVQGGVERALFYLEDVLGVVLDGFGDGVTVGGTEEESAEDEEVEGALEEFDAVLSRHSRWRIWQFT